MKKILAIALTMIMLLSFASCGDRGSDKSIVFPILSSPSTLDPQYTDQSESLTIIENIFEGLVRLDSNGEIIPGIASSWEISNNDLTYTFHLQENTEWYCPVSMKTEFGEDFYNKFAAETLKASDFVFACQRTVDPATSSPNASRLFVIENALEIAEGSLPVTDLGVYAPDDFTLIFNLKETCDDFLLRLTECEFMPCNEEFFTSMNGRYGLSSRYILCNGPFYLSSWNSETSATIKRNKCYAGSQNVLPSSVIFSFNNTNQETVQKLENGTLSAAFLNPDCSIPKNAIESTRLENYVYGFCFNCSDSFLSVKKIRLALCESIVRSNFETELENYSMQDGLIPQSCYVGDIKYRSAVGDKTPALKQSDDIAQKNWKSGLKKLELEQINLTILCTPEMDPYVRLQLQQWQKLFGMSCAFSIENLDAESIRNAVEKGDYQIAFSGIGSKVTNPVIFLNNLCKNNVFKFKTDEYKKITEKLLMCGNNNEILSGCFTAETYLLENAFFYPIYSRSSRFVISEDISDITIGDSESSVCFINAKRFD